MTGIDDRDNVAKRRWFRSREALIWENGVGEGVVFDPSSGQTHFLSDLPSLIVSVVDEEPATYMELLERFSGPVDLDSRAESQIFAALVSLEGAELVESQLV